MPDFALAQRTIDALAPALPAVAQPMTTNARRPLYDLVADAIEIRGESEALRDFVQNPANSALVKRLLAEIIDTDPQFRQQLTSLMNTAAPAATPWPVTNNRVVQRDNVVGGHMAGRDIHQDSSRKNYGGIVVGFVAVVVVIAVLLIGKNIILPALSAVTSGSLSGSSTCRDYLASADREDKVSVMKHLYLAHNKPHQAADPFIVENTEYYCGNSPNTTLDSLARQVGNN